MVYANMGKMYWFISDFRTPAHSLKTASYKLELHINTPIGSFKL